MSKNKLIRKQNFDLDKKVKSMKNLFVKAGYPKENSETNSQQDGVTALEKATINNFGIGVPERPFMDIAYAKNRTKYRKLIFKAHNNIENLNQISFLNKLGIEAVNDIQDTILELKSPSNSDLTIQLKGSSNPLIDTGHMRQSTTYAVEKVK